MLVVLQKRKPLHVFVFNWLYIFVVSVLNFFLVRILKKTILITFSLQTRENPTFWLYFRKVIILFCASAILVLHFQNHKLTNCDVNWHLLLGVIKIFHSGLLNYL